MIYIKIYKVQKLVDAHEQQNKSRELVKRGLEEKSYGQSTADPSHFHCTTLISTKVYHGLSSGI